MAQNISLLGASYSAVPAVTLPRTGGGTARFDDCTVVTAAASDVASGKIFVASDGTITTGTNSGGGGDFVVTLSYNDSTEMWEPDCTYAEAYAAVQAEKNVLFETPADSFDPCFGLYNADEFGGFYYVVDEGFSELNGTPYYDWGVYSKCYIWTSSGIEVDDSQKLYNTSPATATASDVASGKYYYGSDGIHVGTNSGGGGSSKNVQVAQSTSRATSSTYTSLVSLTCSTAGTYDVYWSCYRSTTGGTTGSQLYVGGSAYGTANTTFTNHIQNNHLTGVQLTKNQTVAVYARSRGNNYYAYVGTLTIVQTA